MLIREAKIIFKSDIPEEALNAMAMVYVEEIEKILESEEGRAAFEEWMKAHSTADTQ